MILAFICGMLMCWFLVGMGILIWFYPHPFIIKFMVSALCILSGIALMAIGIDVFKDDL